MKRTILLLFAIVLMTVDTQAQRFFQQKKIYFPPTNNIVEGRYANNLALKNNVLTVGSNGELSRPWEAGDPISTPSRIYNANTQSYYIAQRLTDVSFDDPYTYNTRFGTASATNGTVSVFGEPRYYEGGNSADATGSATVFELVAGAWQPKQRLLASDKSPSSSFGTSVAVNDDYIFVGTKVFSQYNTRAGAVYIYKKDGNNDWVEVQILSPEAGFDYYSKPRFGNEVVVSGDFLFVTSNKNASVIAGGAFAHVYKKDGSGVWQFHQYLNVPAGYNFAGDASTVDGNYFAISGTPSGVSHGSVLIFEKDAGDIWTFKQRLDDPSLQFVASFGRSISLSGGLLAVGSNTESKDENGQNNLTGAGAVFIFKRDAQALWVQNQKVTPYDRFQSGFGSVVALEGNTLVVSSNIYFKSQFGEYQASTYYEGEIYIFKTNSSTGLPNEASDTFTPRNVGSMLFKTADLQPILTIGMTGAQSLKNNLTTVKVWKDVSLPLDGANKLYLARHYQITPTSNVGTSTGTITLYFNQQEFLDFNANPAKTADFPINASDTQGIANLRILKISGSSNDGTGAINTYVGTQLIINPDDDKIIWNAADARWEVTFSVTGFSGFFATTTPTVLPVKLIDYTAENIDKGVNLKWTTATESNNKKFEIYRSGDDKQFVKLGEVAGFGTRLVIGNYSFLDKSPLLGNNYYKLVQVDLDGAVADLGIKSLNYNLQSTTFNLFPNPTKDKVSMQFEAGKYQTLTIRNTEGKLIRTVVLTSNDQEMMVDLVKFPKGIYFITLAGDHGNSTKKVIKN